MLHHKRRTIHLYFFPAALIALLLAGCGRLFSTASSPEEIPPLVLEKPPQEAFETLDAFENATVPARDLVDLAHRYKGIADLPSVARTEPAGHGVGDRAPFWSKNHDSGETVQVEAVLAYQSDELNLWIEEEYNSQRHSAIGMTPLDRFALDMKHINFLPPNEDNDELFYAEETRKVKKDNTFSFKNVRYEAPVELRDKTITIRFDRSRLDKVIVYYKNQRAGKAGQLDLIANSKIIRGRV